MRNIFLLLAAVAFFSCSTNSTKSGEIEDVEVPSYANLIEEAHSKDSFLKEEFIAFDIVLEFGGTERLNGTMTLATNSSKGKIKYKDGRELIFLEDKVYADSSFQNPMSARFAAYTWSYFFLFPYKLSDPGTNWSDPSQVDLNGKAYNSAKLTFGEGVGDAPDDWYITYADTASDLMEVAAYIVTAGGTAVEDAEEDPHAISYDDYKDVNGVQLAHSWKFWEWRKDSGLTKQLGKAELSAFQFLTEDKVDFAVPNEFIAIE